jgi:hypothetical protein
VGGVPAKSFSYRQRLYQGERCRNFLIPGSVKFERTNVFFPERVP